MVAGWFIFVDLCNPYDALIMVVIEHWSWCYWQKWNYNSWWIINKQQFLFRSFVRTSRVCPAQRRSWWLVMMMISLLRRSLLLLASSPTIWVGGRQHNPPLHFWQARFLSNYCQGQPNFAWVINFKFNNRISTHVKQLSWQKSLCWIILRACVGVTTFLLRHSTASRDHTLLAFFQPAFWSTQISTWKE